MSTFLHPEAFSIAAGTGQGAIQTTVDGKLTAQGYQRITYDTVNFISDFIPPATETIGDGRFRQVARIYYNTADISLSMYDYPTANAHSQMYRLSEKTAGAVQPGVYIAGSTPITATASASGTTLTVTAVSGPAITVGSPVYYTGSPVGLYVSALGTGTGGTGTYTLSASVGTVTSQSMTLYNATLVVGTTGSAGSTAKDNLYQLWVALASSVDANVTLWKYTYLPGIGASDGIFMEANAVSSLVLFVQPNTNINGGAQGDAILANAPTAYALQAALSGKSAFTIDRTNGFYVYMNIFSRAFNIGIKTTTSFFGWGFCYWMPNADALLATPLKPVYLINAPCHIQEGFYGFVNGTAAAPQGTYSVKTPNAFAVGIIWTYSPTSSTSGTSAYCGTATNGGVIPGVFCSYNSNLHYSNGSDVFLAYTVNVNVNSGTGTPDIFNVAVAPVPFAPTNISGVIDPCYPAVYLEDVFVAGTSNTDGNEVTCVAGLNQPSNITLQQNLDDTTAYTSILLNTVTGLATAGFLIFNQEVFQYTGVSGGNTVTGVTRAYNASPQKRHFIGDQVLQAGWFIKMNGGFAYMGIARPTAV